MHDLSGIMLRNLDGRMRGRCRRAADQQWHFETETLHFLRDVYHFIE